MHFLNGVIIVNLHGFITNQQKQVQLNPGKPEFTIKIFNHYKPQMPITILALPWMNETFKCEKCQGVSGIANTNWI